MEADDAALRVYYERGSLVSIAVGRHGLSR